MPLPNDPVPGGTFGLAGTADASSLGLDRKQCLPMQI